MEKTKKKAPLDADELVSRLKKALKSSPTASPLAIMEECQAPSPLVIVGPEQIRVKRLIQWIKNSIFGEKFSSSVYFGPELSTEKSCLPILESLKSYSLFSTTELIVIYEAQAIKAQITKLLVPALSTKSSSAYVILAAPNIPQKSSLISELEGNCSIFNIEPLKDRSLVDWIKKEATRGGASGGIEQSAAELLAASYGNDLSSIVQETAKLALAVTPGQPITKALVLELCTRTPERTSFELLKQIGNKNLAASTMLVKELEDQGQHPLQICAFLSRCFRTMLAQKDMGNISGSPLSGELGNPWFLRNLQPTTKLFSLSELKSAVTTIKDLDLKLKGSGFPDSLTLSLTVEKLTLRAL